MGSPISYFRKLATGLAALVAVGLSVGGAHAATIYNISGGGLDDGHACLSSASAGACAAEALFSVNDTFSVTGTITIDSVNNLADINITLTSGSFVGDHNGVAEVVFTDTTFVVTDYNIMSFGNNVFGLGTSASISVGTFTQFDAGAAVVGGPTGFGEAATASAFSCSINGTGGICGFTIGSSRDFDLPVGGDSLDFVSTFNVSVAVSPVPEPSAALVFAIGLLVVTPIVRRNQP